MLVSKASVCSRGRLTQEMLIDSLEGVLQPRECYPEALSPMRARMMMVKISFMKRDQ